MSKKLVIKKADLQGISQLADTLVEQAEAGEVDMGTVKAIAAAAHGTVDGGKPEDDLPEGTGSPETELNAQIPAPAPAVTPSAGAQAPAMETPAPAPPAPEKPKFPDIAKGEAPNPVAFSTVPPMQNRGINVDEMESKLPDFIKVLSNETDSDSLRKARALCGGDTAAFDRMFNLACKETLNELGFNIKNMRKIHAGAMDIDPEDTEGLKKAISSSDVSGYYLQKLAKLMLPVYAGLVKRLPASTPEMGGQSAHWKVQFGFQSFTQADLMDVGEAEIGDEVTEPLQDFAAPFQDVAVNDKVNLKAIAASKNFDDPMQISIIRTMTLNLIGVERKTLGGNYTVLGTMGIPTGTPNGAGSGLGGNNDDKFQVTPLTYYGWLAGANGVVAPATTAKGEGLPGISAAVDLSTCDDVDVAWAWLEGAVAFNIYYLPHGVVANGVYLGTYTVNAINITDLTAIVAHKAPTANGTASTASYEGMVAWAEKSEVYGVTIPQKVVLDDLAGAALSVSGAGIEQIDEALATLWEKYQIAPSLMLMSPKSHGKVSNLIATINSGLLYHRQIQLEEIGGAQGGLFFTSYTNHFASYADGTPKDVKLMPHPYFPDNQILLLSETIPYPTARESRGFAREILIPWTYFPLAPTKIHYPYALTTTETLECYNPQPQSAIVGFA